MATNNHTKGNEPVTKEQDEKNQMISQRFYQTKDIDTYYLKDLKCEICGESLRLLNYDRFSDIKGQHFIVARMWCDDHKNIWVRPDKKERIYLDGPDASTIKNLEDVHMVLSSLASSMEKIEVPLSWEMSMDFWGFREDFSDAIKAKLQILRDFEGIVERE